MEELVIVQNGKWRFLLEAKGKNMFAWPYYEDKPLTLTTLVKKHGVTHIQFKKMFPYPVNYWEKSTKILVWCKRFAKTKKFREIEIKEYLAALNLEI